MVKLFSPKFGKFHFHQVFLLVYAVLLGLAYMFPHKLWAFSAIVVYPLWFQLLFWLLLGMLAFPEILDRINAWLEQIGNFLFITHKKFAPFIVVGISLIILVIAWNDHMLLGDTVAAYTFVKEYPESFQTFQLFQYRIFSIALYRLFFAGVSFLLTCWRALSILHILVGLVYSFFAYKIAGLLADSSRKKLSALLLLLFSATFIAYNHIEFYAFPLLCSIITYFLLIKALPAKSMRYYFLIPAVIGFFFHPLLFYLVGFVIIILLIQRYKHQGWDIVLFMTLLISLLFIIAAGYFQIMQGVLLIENISYFFSFPHLLTVFNYIIFTAPIIVVVFLKSNEKENIISSSLLWAAFATVILASLLSFNFGGGDWDLLAFILLPVLLYSTYRVVRTRRVYLLPFFVAFAILFSIQNILIGVNPVNEYKRAELLLLNQRVPYIEDTLQFPGLIRLAFNATEQFVEFDRPVDKKYAQQYAFATIEKYPKDDRGYLYLSSLYQHTKNYRMAELILHKGFETVETRARIYQRISQVHLKQRLADQPHVKKVTTTKTTVSDSALAAIEESTLNTLDHYILFVQTALSILGIEKTSVIIEPDHVYWSLTRINTIIFVELSPADEPEFLIIYAPLSKLPKDPRKFVPLSTFLLQQNSLARMDVMKFSVQGDIIYIGATQRLEQLTINETVALLKMIGQMAERSKEIFQKDFVLTPINRGKSQ